MNDQQRLNKLRTARRHLENTIQGHKQWEASGKTGSEWKAATKALNELAADLAPPKPPSKVPNLGPVIKNGKSMLFHDLTHVTGGLDDYPAFDDAIGRPGLEVIAPEALSVTKKSSARRRDGTANGKAFYATGKSGIKYWFGHIDVAPAVGTRFTKGQVMAKISSNHEAPHLHVGADFRELTGGKQLAHHTDYTHGAPLIGVQLEAML